MLVKSRERKVERENDCGLARSSRRGLSLTEVLIAMGILTLGLLGVAMKIRLGRANSTARRIPLASRSHAASSGTSTTLKPRVRRCL